MIIYWYEGSKNIIGPQVKHLRKNHKWTQKVLTEKLQLLGYDFNDLTVLRIERGDRFVADYEIKALSEVFRIPVETLFDPAPETESSQEAR